MAVPLNFVILKSGNLTGVPFQSDTKIFTPDIFAYIFVGSIQPKPLVQNILLYLVDDSSSQGSSLLVDGFNATSLDPPSQGKMQKKAAELPAPISITKGTGYIK